MIFCLIWLLSYEGSISNAFLVWRNISVGRAVILVFCRDTNRVVEEVVVQFVQLSFVNALDRTSIQCFQILSERPLLHSFSLMQCWTRLNPLNNLWSFKSLIFWWTSTSGDIASDEMLLTNLLLMASSLQEHFSSDASSFNLVDSFALFCSFRTL